MDLVIMAAGMGSRYGGLKQLEAFGSCGETLLEYSLFDARKAGFTRCVFIIRRDIENAFKDQLVKRFAAYIDSEFVYQELDDLPGSYQLQIERQKPWGTGHAVWAARSKVKGPFAVINADDFYGCSGFIELAKFLQSLGEHHASQMRAALVGYRLANTLSAHGKVARGVCHVTKSGKLSSIEEHTEIERRGNVVISQHGASVVELNEDVVVSMNCWGFDAHFFDCLGRHFAAFLERHGQNPKSEFYLPFVVDSELTAGRMSVDVLTTDSQWFGVTYPQDKDYVHNQIRQLIEDGAYPRELWASIS